MHGWIKGWEDKLMYGYLWWAFQLDIWVTGRMNGLVEWMDATLD